MKIVKRFFCIVLSAIMLFSCVAIASSAEEDKYLNDSPFIFVHGLNGWGSGEGINSLLPYWGATTGNLMDYLQSKGYESYSCSVGPLNSAWDRACELYAQLTGTTVDYGEAHSTEHHHARYGRTYDTALVPDWGTIDEDGKIHSVHLIGHSFGGTAIRVLVQLLAKGSAEERSATDPKELSGLFTGGKASWAKSVTAICAPHNSTSLYYYIREADIMDPYLYLTYGYAALAGRSKLNGLYVDFHLEQYGLTNIPGQNNAGSYFKTLGDFFADPEDSAQFDLMPSGCKAINNWVDAQEGVYYFSYAFSTAKDTGLFSIHTPISTTNPLLFLPTTLMGTAPTFTDKTVGVTYDSSWHESDGLVNTISEKYPMDEPWTDYDSNNIRPGVWNVMPVRTGDHGTAIGLLADADSTHEFYDEIAQMLNSLPD